MTYGHEAAVLGSIANFLSSSVPLVTWEVHDKSWLADRNCSQVMLGSGRSNIATQAVIGTPEAPTFTPKLWERAVKLHYAIGLGSGHPKRMQYHKELRPRAMSVCQNGRGPILQAETSGGWQKDDYLLVTRIPGPSPDSVYTVLSGLHGPGTRSTELLLNAISLRDLQELASMIDHKPGRVSYFQAVFRGSEFKNFDGSYVPTHLELVTTKCPPVRIENL